MKNFSQYLENSPLKTTPQRLAILKEIDKKGHANVDEIYKSVKQNFPSISLATIYKNIISLKEANILSEVCTPYKNKFEITKEPHAHFICKQCASIEDIPFDETVNATIEEKYPNSTKQLYIYGICQNCKQ
jgi:Fe2+ or Zn2+ uptake regulation protein